MGQSDGAGAFWQAFPGTGLDMALVAACLGSVPGLDEDLDTVLTKPLGRTLLSQRTAVTLAIQPGREALARPHPVEEIKLIVHA